MSGWSIGRYGEKRPLLTDPWLTTSTIDSNNLIICTAPEASPLSLMEAPRCLILPKYPEVPPPSLDIIPTSDCEYKIFPMSSSTCEPKQLIGKPLSFPKFDQTGDASE